MSKNTIDSIQKFNLECLDEIVNHKPMVLEDVLSQLTLELATIDSDIRLRLKNIKLYSTIGLMLLVEDKTCLVTRSTGDRILLENSFYRDLIALMNTSAFKTFRANHMTKDIQASLIYFELYEMLGKFYTKKTGVDIPDDIGVELLKTIMDKKEYRGPLVRVLRRYIDNGGGNRDKLYIKLSEIMFTQSEEHGVNKEVLVLDNR
jgi:D-alanyl-D-alanine dipeptidase